jgi:hypothetical protein
MTPTGSSILRRGWPRQDNLDVTVRLPHLVTEPRRRRNDRFPIIAGHASARYATRSHRRIDEATDSQHARPQSRTKSLAGVLTRHSASWTMHG